MEKLPFKARNESALEKWRLETFHTKEPETIAWIDGFAKGDTLLDVGANIGLYSLYAGVRGHRVIAVEPHPTNWRVLFQNVRANGLKGRVIPIQAVMAERVGLRDFYFPSLEAGVTGNGVREETQNQQKAPVCVFTIDWAFGCWRIDHVKIDVDGNEGPVLLGMQKALQGRLFESCLIEVPFAIKDLAVFAFEECGYNLNDALNQTENHSRVRRALEGIDVENLIFRSNA